MGAVLLRSGMRRLCCLGIMSKSFFPLLFSSLPFSFVSFAGLVWLAGLVGLLWLVVDLGALRESGPS